MNVLFNLHFEREDQMLLAIGALVESLASINHYFLSTKKLAPLYETPVRYVDDQGAHWRDAAEVLRSGEGNCQSLSAWRIAELRLSGEEARVHIKISRKPLRFHVTVRRSDGTVEDPSLLLRSSSSSLDRSVRRLILLKGQRT